MQPIIDTRASSLPELFDCPARWESKYVKGLRLPRSGKAQLGTAIHAATAAYDFAQIEGTPITADEAAGAAVDAIHKPDEDVLWEDDLSPGVAEGIAVALNKRYCDEIAPTQKYIGVEVTCNRVEIPEIGLAFTGTTDRVREAEPGVYGIADLKSGGNAVSASGAVTASVHKAQLGVYELLATQALGTPMQAPAQVIGLNTGKTAKAQRVATAEVPGALQSLVGTEDEPGALQIASKILHGGLFFGNPRSMLCSEKYCPAFKTCRFRG